MKTVIFIAIVYLLISIPNSQAGIGSFFTWFQGECDKEDENEVQFCTESKTGKIYYVYEGIAFNSYPDIKKDQRVAMNTKKCQKCGSRHPHLHPSVQSGGEVELCTNDFHLTPTNQNKHEYIKAVIEKRNRKTK